MNCANCGRAVAGEVNFCPYCGKPVERGSATTESMAWEYCQIEASWEARLFSWRCFFGADAVGRNGAYRVGWSDEYTLRSNPPPAGLGKEAGELSQSALSGLASALIRDGWEASPDRGEAWWQLRFRRKEYYPDFSVGQMSSEPTSTFDGEWIFERCAGSFRYGIMISGALGTCIAPYIRNVKKGERMLQIKGVAGPKFVGKHLFMDGRWYTVTGMLEGNMLYLRGPQ